MRKLFFTLLLAVVPLVVKAQPFPPNVLAGHAGDGVVYVATHTLGPGTGTNAGTVVYNTFVVTNVAFINYLTNNVFVNTNVAFINIETNNTFVNTNIAIFRGRTVVNYLVVSNGIAYQTNLWAGPTNAVSIASVTPYDLNYVSFTACSVTNITITGMSNDVTGEALLSLYNASATNWNLTLGVNIMDASGARTFTIPNGGMGLLWLRYSPQGPVTNSVFRAFPATALTANTSLYADSSGGVASIPNAAGVYTNSGAGLIGWSPTLSLDELDVTDFYPTNMFLKLTNVIVSTDGNGQATNLQILSGLSFSANALGLSAQPTNEVTRQINSSTNIYASLGTAISDLSLGTNLTIRYDTNPIPSSGVITFGHAYFTNLQASVTLPAFTLGNAFYETAVIIVTNSSGSDTTLTMPAGVKVALANGGGNLIYCTNKTRTSVYIEHYGNWITNAYKNDY